jgi:hypothetical protein
MTFKILFYSLFLLTIFACRPSNKIQNSGETIKAYIKEIGLDTIARQDLLKNDIIQFTQKGIKITQATAYFDKGSFTNVQQQTFAGNKLTFLNLAWVSNAKTPYRITIADIRYIDIKGNKGIAEEFSFTVF